MGKGHGLKRLIQSLSPQFGHRRLRKRKATVVVTAKTPQRKAS